MISHKYKCIFIHIPKCAGTSVNCFLADNQHFDWTKPNYEYLYGWCPVRKIHLQHATASQMIELDLVTKEQWESYFKFTIVRNPWDRAYSDYLWMKKDRRINDSFKSYIYKTGKFISVLNDDSNMSYRGDHLLQQTEFFDFNNGFLGVDRVIRFENLAKEISDVTKFLKIKKKFDLALNISSNRKKHYSYFYTASRKKWVSQFFSSDIKKLEYNFDDQKEGIHLFKNFI